VQPPKDSSSDEALNVDIPGEVGKLGRTPLRRTDPPLLDRLVTKKTSAAAASSMPPSSSPAECQQAVHLSQLGDTAS